MPPVKRCEPDDHDLRGTRPANAEPPTPKSFWRPPGLMAFRLWLLLTASCCSQSGQNLPARRKKRWAPPPPQKSVWTQWCQNSTLFKPSGDGVGRLIEHVRAGQPILGREFGSRRAVNEVFVDDLLTSEGIFSDVPVPQMGPLGRCQREILLQRTGPRHSRLCLTRPGAGLSCRDCSAAPAGSSTRARWRAFCDGTVVRDVIPFDWRMPS